MGWDKASTVPSVNVTEADNEYRISVAAPGLQKEDFKLEVDGNMITISAEKKEEKVTRKEYNFTSFSRTFTLPDNVMSDKIEAHYENGELKLKLPKIVDEKATKQKKIEIM
jgi:HSP20 family protein